VLVIDLPGVRREELQLSVDGRILVVAGRRGSVAGDGGAYRMTGSEHALGAFVRRVPLPPPCRVEEINARLHDGVLEIRVPHDGAAGSPRRAISVS
jgi:HSP20 family protein